MAHIGQAATKIPYGCNVGRWTKPHSIRGGRKWSGIGHSWGDLLSPRHHPQPAGNAGCGRCGHAVGTGHLCGHLPSLSTASWAASVLDHPERKRCEGSSAAAVDVGCVGSALSLVGWLHGHQGRPVPRESCAAIGRAPCGCGLLLCVLSRGCFVRGAAEHLSGQA
jgi:hypothetical protein